MKNHLRSILIFSFLIIGCAALFAGGAKESDGTKVVVYTTKSFAADYGPGPKIAELFKAKTGKEVEYVICKEGVLNRVILEGKASTADVLIGIDNHLIEKARKAKVLKAYKPTAADKIDSAVLIADDWLLTPFDYGYFAFMFDTKAKIKKPSSLKELIEPAYAKKIVILDPSSSTTGLGLAAWTRAVFGDNYLDFWKALKPNIFAMAPKWSTGYGYFTAGEAPIAISYTSSLASHVLYDKTNRFQPLIFEEGHIIQIEGMGIAANAANTKGAKEFIDFMLTEEAQSLLPETQFMYPVIKGLALPASYKDVPKPAKVLRIPSEDQTESVNAVINVLQK